MAIGEHKKPDGEWSVKATGKDTAALAGVFGDVAERERDARLSGDSQYHRTAGMWLVFDPPGGRFVGFAPDGRCIYSEPWGDVDYEEVEGGYAVKR